MDLKHQGFPQFASEGKNLNEIAQPAMYANMERHPTEKMGSNAFADRERRHLQHLSVMYGSHMAQRVVMDRNILASNQRVGGTGSSMHALQYDMGRYNVLDFSDIMNDPRENPEPEKESAHDRCAKIYGL